MSQLKILSLFASWLRRAAKRRILKIRDRKGVAPVAAVIHNLQTRWPNAFKDDGDQPIFLLSAGWRSGSTLLQRLIMSDKHVMIWGEPYNHCNFIQNQMNSLQAITSHYPDQAWFLNSLANDKKDLSRHFIANMYPDIDYLWNANRAFWKTLLRDSSLHQGFRLWGMKEVRLGIQEAYFLQWLFPKAKFLFLYRNPYHAYKSLKPHILEWSLYRTWPSTPIRSVTAFARLWKDLVSGFVNEGPKLQGLLIKYEDLCSGNYPLARIEDYLGIEISRDILINKIGGTENKMPLTKTEKFLIKHTADPMAKALGY